jgi:hypothetical protein
VLKRWANVGSGTRTPWQFRKAQPSECPQRQCDLSFRVQRRMTAGENQTQPVIRARFARGANGGRERNAPRGRDDVARAKHPGGSAALPPAPLFLQATFRRPTFVLNDRGGSSLNKIKENADSSLLPRPIHPRPRNTSTVNNVERSSV